jgi:hypothetical protein
LSDTIHPTIYDRLSITTHPTIYGRLSDTTHRTIYGRLSDTTHPTIYVSQSTGRRRRVVTLHKRSGSPLSAQTVPRDSRRRAR